MSTSAELKALGNKAVAEGKFDEAIAHYTEAIEVDPTNHVLFSNRSAAFCSNKNYDAALVDADKVIAIKADWPKGYGRKGAALYGKGDYVGAKMAYEEGLKHDAANKMLIDGQKLADDQIKRQMNAQSGMGGQMNQMAALFAAPDAISKLVANPKTAPYFADGGFVQKLQAIQKNPSLLQSSMDEKIIMCMMVLMGRGDIMDAAEKADADVDEAEKEVEAKAKAEEEAKAKAKSEAEAKAKAEAEAKAKAEAEADPASAAKAEAEATKAKGTAAYKKKDFETALTFYRKAFELDSSNMVYLLNVGAVLIEMKQYEECVKECTRAVEVGQDNRADYKHIAKAFARIAKAYYLQGDHAQSIRFYDRALANDRSQVFLKEKKKVEKELKEAERKAYIDPAKAAEAKERGNALFKAGDFPGAIKEYTEAIKRNPSDAKLYSNRAACYTKLVEPNFALKDAEECIKLDPTFIKGYVRKGASLLALREKKKAEAAYAKAAEIDANHPEVVQGLQRCRAYSYGAQAGQTREERAEAAMQDPEIQGIMRDPVMQQILQQMQDDPSALKEHMQNPAIAEKIQKLFEAGIIGTR